MKRSIPLVVLLLAATSCSGPVRETDRSGDYAANDVAAPPAEMTFEAPGADRSPAAQSGPNISPTAAPGVAFNYRYAFRLPAQRIAAVQEQHAQTCERLGVARCRITGMRFRVINDRDIEAMLAFRLDPSIARHFGRDAAELVVNSEGMLVDSEISGTDVGTSIRATGRNIAEMNEELARIEARLQRPGLSRDERSRLENEAQQLRQSIRANRASRDDQQDSLATTPMVFRYGSGDFVPGFDTRPSFRRAGENALDNFIDGLSILFVLVVTLLPWALLGLLGWWLVRLIRRRFRTAAPVGETSPPIEEPQVS